MACHCLLFHFFHGIPTTSRRLFPRHTCNHGALRFHYRSYSIVYFCYIVAGHSAAAICWIMLCCYNMYDPVKNTLQLP